MKKLLIYLKGYEKETVLAPLFKMLEALFELFVPLVMAAVIDTGIGGSNRGYIVRKMCIRDRVRIVAGALLVIVMAKLLNTTDYLGTGMNVVERALDGETEAAAFLLKIVFTAVTLGCGFRGDVYKRQLHDHR